MEIKNLEELESYLRKANLFSLLGIKRIGVFGSFARKENFKDIDLLIEDNVNLESLITFKNILKKDLDVPVDIVLSKCRTHYFIPGPTRFEICKTRIKVV